MDLEEVAQLASVPTPQAHDVTGRSEGQKEIHGTKHGCACLVRTAMLASVPTPNTMDVIDRKGLRPSRIATNRESGYLTEMVAQLASVPTDGQGGRTTLTEGGGNSHLDIQVRQAQLAASGPTATGGTGATGSTGQLNAAYSRWLQGLPAEFDQAAIRAYRFLKSKTRPKRG
jgi:hypothetical protein